MTRLTLLTELKLTGGDIDGEEFAKFFTKLMPSKKNSQLKEKLGEMSREDQIELWQCCYQLLMTEARPFLQERRSDDVEIEEKTSSTNTIKVMVSLTVTFLEQLVSDDFIPPKLINTISILYGLMPKVIDVDKNLCDNIAKLCELWWCSNRLNRADYILNVLEYLMKSSVITSTTMVFTKRLWAVRESFLLIDFSSPNKTVACVKSMFVDCIKANNFWKCDEGKNLFSYLFYGVKGDFYKDLHKLFMDSIPQFSKTKCLAVGEVYFKAWKNLSDTKKAAFEECLQDMMYLSIHTPPTTANNLRLVLTAFAKQKHVAKVDGMLLKLLNPILWRSLKVANAHVRLNAANMLICFFPLRDGDIPAFENAKLLDRQQEMFKMLLTDPSFQVRESAVIGICDLSAKFWELFQANMLKFYLDFIIGQLSLDTSSMDVRAAVYKGLGLLLENPITHSTLKLLLPKLAKGIHDSSEKVRLSFLSLLTKMKGLNTLKYWDVVPMEHIVCRMAIDTPVVSKTIVKLIFNSFCPLSRPSTVIISRIVTLIRMNRQASRHFYRYISSCMSSQDAAEHLFVLLRFLYVSLKGSNIISHSDSSSGDEELGMEREVIENENESADCAVLTAIIECIVILWTAMGRELIHPNLLEIRKKMVKTAGKVIPLCLKRFTDGESHSSVLFLASLVPASAVPFLSQSMIKQLKSFQYEDICKDQGNVLSLLEPSCFWSFGQLSDMIVESFSKNAHDIEPPDVMKSKGKKASAKRKVTGKKVQFSEELDLKETQLTPDVAAEYLALLLSNPSCRQYILRSHRDKLSAIAKATDSVKIYIRNYLEKKHLSGFASLEEIVKLYKLNLLVNWLFIQPNNMVEKYAEEVGWLSPLLNTADPAAFIFEIAEVVLEVTECLFLIGTADELMFPIVFDLLNAVIPSSHSIVRVISLMSQCSEFLMFNATLSQRLDVLDTLVAKPYGLVLQKISASDASSLTENSGSVAPLIVKILVNCCLMAGTVEVMSFAIHSLLQASVEACISSQVKLCQQTGRLDVILNKDSDSHLLFEMLVSDVFIKTTSLHRLFFAAVSNCLSETVGDKDKEYMIGVCAQLLLLSRNSKKVAVELLNSTIDSLVRTYQAYRNPVDEVDPISVAVGELVQSLTRTEAEVMQ